MNQVSGQHLLDEAMRIGDELLQRAKLDPRGLSWNTMFLSYEGGQKQIVWGQTAGIYSGVSGIALFLLELYRQTDAERYLTAAVSATAWVDHRCQTQPADSYALYTGRMGVVYAKIRMSQVTGDRRYLDRALALARPVAEELAAPSQIDDLLNGTAGTLLGLLHLHAASAEEWILAAIDRCVAHLLRRAHPGPVGLYWDRDGQQIRGLCGFSHGAAGIGTVFLELAHYFQNEGYRWVAEQAFAYEAHFFNAEQNNWPDFRKGIYKEADFIAHQQAFEAGDQPFFTEPGYMNAWCHGAAGIGLSRLRAYELTQKEAYASEAWVAIEKNAALNMIVHPEFVPSFNLCHGVGGNAELFLEARRVLGDETCWELAEQAAGLALGLKQAGKSYLSGYQIDGLEEEDNSLFMGNAGIGYFLLRTFAPQEVPSILLPRIQGVCSALRQPLPYISMPLPEIRQTVGKKLAPRTLFLLETLIPEKVESFYADEAYDYGDFKPGLVDWIETTIATLPADPQPRLLDAWAVEKRIIALDDRVLSQAYLRIKEWVQVSRGQDVAGLDDDALLALQLQLDADLVVLVAKWSWTTAPVEECRTNLTNPPQSFPLLLKPERQGVKEIPLSPLTYLIFRAFENGCLVSRALDEALQAFETGSPGLEAKIKEAAVGQIKEGLSAGLLICSQALESPVL